MMDSRGMHGRWAMQSGRALSSERLQPMSPKQPQSVSFSPPSPGLSRPATSGTVTFSPPSPDLPRPATSGCVPCSLRTVRSPDAMPLSLMPDNIRQFIDQGIVHDGCFDIERAVDNVTRSSVSARATRRRLQAQRRLLASRGLWRPRSSDALMDAELGADMSPRASAGPAEAVAIPEWAIQVSHWRDEALDSVRFGSSKVCTGIDTAVKDAAAQAGQAERASRQAIRSLRFRQSTSDKRDQAVRQYEKDMARASNMVRDMSSMGKCASRQASARAQKLLRDAHGANGGSGEGGEGGEVSAVERTAPEHIGMGSVGADKLSSSFLALQQRKRLNKHLRSRRRHMQGRQTRDNNAESLAGNVTVDSREQSFGGLPASSWELGSMYQSVQLFSPELGLVNAPRRIAVSHGRNRGRCFNQAQHEFTGNGQVRELLL